MGKGTAVCRTDVHKSSTLTSAARRNGVGNAATIFLQHVFVHAGSVNRPRPPGPFRFRSRNHFNYHGALHTACFVVSASPQSR